MTMQDQGGSESSTSADSFALEHTPTWAVAAVCVVFIALSLLMQRGLQRLGTWLLSSHKKPLYEALEKMKEELMLLGFISLLLTAAQNPMSRLCMPASWANQMLPCHFHSADNFPKVPSPLAPSAATHHLVIHRSTLPTSGRAEQPVHIRKTLSLPKQDIPRRRLSGMTTRNFCSKDHVPLMSTESLHQLHIFIFVMAVVHVFYSCFTMLFGFWQDHPPPGRCLKKMVKKRSLITNADYLSKSRLHVKEGALNMNALKQYLRSWRKWEEETNADNYNYTDEIKKSFNEEAFRKMPFRKMGLGSMRRQSTFVTSRTMTPWATTICGIWFNSFFRQFGKSVSKSDYLTLRLGFIKNHNAPMHLNFHKYIMNSLEDDLKTVIGISLIPLYYIIQVSPHLKGIRIVKACILPSLITGTLCGCISGYLWLFVIFFMILNVHGWYAYFWMSFIPVLINLVIGAKLQHIITQLAMETAHAHGIVAVPIKPRDELFWFNNPHLLLYLIHFVLFQNAFELAFCIWLVTTFGINSCFFAKHGFIITRVIVGILAQVLCSYSTLPLYALVSQMGSHYRRAIFADPVSTAVTDWRNKAKANIRQLQKLQKKESEHVTEAACGATSNSHCHDHDHAHVHHHHCSSTLLVTSDGEGRSRTHQDNVLIHPAEASQSQIDGTKTHLVRRSPKKYCGQCERLSLTLQMDTGDCEGNARERIGNRSQACAPDPEHLLGSAKTKAVYVKISSEDTTDGSPHWSLECNECKSFRALTVESNDLKNDEGKVGVLPGDQEAAHEGDVPKSPTGNSSQVHGKRKSVFLRMSKGFEESERGPLEPAETPQKHGASKGPSLDRMRRLPSREIREMRIAEVVEPFRPDLHIPELMMCTTHQNDPRVVVDFAKSTSFSSGSGMTAGSSFSPSSCDTQLASQAVQLEISPAKLCTLSSQGSPPSERAGLRNSSVLTTGMPSTNTPDIDLTFQNAVAEKATVPNVSDPRLNGKFS